MVKRAVGRVSTKGWAKTPEERLRATLMNYRACAFSQSTVYAGRIKSMTYAQFRAAQDPDLLAQVMQRDLEELYGNVFPEGVDVSVTVVFDDDNPARYRVDMSVRVTENDQAYDLHAALSPAVNALGEYERFDIFFN